MSAGQANSTGPDRRRMPRYAIAVPVDVTVLRSGVPDAIPGRTVNFGGGGLAAVLAGELHAGDSVGVELRLQGSPEPLLAKALVRHNEELRCGLEFQHLSVEQREIIKFWSERSDPMRPIGFTRTLRWEPAAVTQAPAPLQLNTPAKPLRRWLWIAAASILLIAGVSAQQWYRDWDELESRVEKQPASAAALPEVDASEIEQLVVHRVDPVYPEAAKRANLQGIVVLATVIGRDGTVEKVSPVSGPDVLTSAAMDAVRWWRFQPYLLNGKPAEIQTMLAVEFRL